MYFNAPRAWDNLPLNLTTDEINDPREVIHEYFSAFDMVDARKRVTKWLNATCKEKPYKQSPSGLLFLYEKTQSLIEAVHLINQMDNTERKAIITQKADEPEINPMMPYLFCAWLGGQQQPPPLRDTWDHFPRSLTYKEFFNPYLVFKKFFSFLSLGQWRELLRDLFSMGLSGSSFLDDGLDFEIINVKKYLEKLIEGAHLIDVREFRQSYFSKIAALSEQKPDTKDKC
jgi:hypothetical protein